MKTKSKKVVAQLRHAPLASEIEKPLGKLRFVKRQSDDFEDNEEDECLPKILSNKITKQANEQRLEVYNEKQIDQDLIVFTENDSDEDEENNLSKFDEEYDERFLEKKGDYIDSLEMTNDEEAVIQRFLTTDKLESRSLADIIMAKLREKEGNSDEAADPEDVSDEIQIPSKVVEVYTSVGKMLQHYKSGKLPKALKMLPHLKNWEHILWLTRPDEWSPSATFAATRVFASNLNAKMAQRFFNLVLLEKCRDDIRVNNKMNYHLYLALKKALFKPAAFYKGLLLPLAQSGTCTLREALIIGSVLSKVSIPGNHSAAVILRLAEMPYSGSTSLFIKILLNKKYALPRRVIEALVSHFCSFAEETRILPVVWHQSFLVFVQRYKLELNDSQKERIKHLLRVQNHHQITTEIRREILSNTVTETDK